MSSAPTVSILISAYEQLEWTIRCVNEIRRTLDSKIPYEIILVDDCSSEATQEKLREWLPPPHQILQNNKRHGFAHNNNLAAQKASAPFLCLLNNDVFVEGEWLAPMLKVFEDHPDAGMVGNVQKRYHNNRYDHMGVVFGPAGNPRHYGQHFLHLPFKNEVREWSAVTAACCVCKRERFLEMNGFDEIFLNGCEDVDLCLRMAKAGYRHFVVHDSIVTHVKGATEGRKTHNQRNARVLNERWGASIRSNQSIKDQYLHAWTYIWRFLIRPWSCNFDKLIEALLIHFRLKRLH